MPSDSPNQPNVIDDSADVQTLLNRLGDAPKSKYRKTSYARVPSEHVVHIDTETISQMLAYGGIMTGRASSAVNVQTIPKEEKPFYEINRWTNAVEAALITLDPQIDWYKIKIEEWLNLQDYVAKNSGEKHNDFVSIATCAMQNKLMYFGSLRHAYAKPLVDPMTAIDPEAYDNFIASLG